MKENLASISVAIHTHFTGKRNAGRRQKDDDHVRRPRFMESVVRSGAIDVLAVVGGMPQACAARLRTIAGRNGTEIREC